MSLNERDLRRSIQDQIDTLQLQAEALLSGERMPDIKQLEQLMVRLSRLQEHMSVLNFMVRVSDGAIMYVFPQKKKDPNEEDETEVRPIRAPEDPLADAVEAAESEIIETPKDEAAVEPEPVEIPEAATEEEPEPVEISEPEEEIEHPEEEQVQEDTSGQTDTEVEEMPEEIADVAFEPVVEVEEPVEEEAVTEEPQEEPLPEAEEVPEPVSEEPRTELPSEDTSLAGKLQRQPISDLTRSVGLNQRFLFSNELFQGNMEAFNRALNEINHMESLDDAQRYISMQLKDRYHWPEESDAVEQFVELVERRFI